jgi:head-tail adaptor
MLFTVPLRSFVSTTEVSAKPRLAANDRVLNVSFLTVTGAERRLRLLLAVTIYDSAEEKV